MKRKNVSQKVIRIPITLPILIIIAISIIIAGLVGTEIIIKSAKYIVSDVLITADGNFEYTELSDGTIDITKYIGASTEVIIPEAIDEKVVTSIGKRAFSGCKSLSSIEIPETVANIGEWAFANCENLIKIKLPANIESIPAYTFYNCKNLSNITMPNNLTTIGESSFHNCKSLSSIEIPETVASIEMTAFSHCEGLKEIKIPEKVKNIEYRTFYYCTNLTNIQISEGVTSIGIAAFEHCENLSNIEIPQSVTELSGSAFNGCTNLSNIKVDIDNSKYMSENGIVFDKAKTEIIRYPEGKKDETYTIPEGVKTIGSGAFEACKSFRSIKLLDGVTDIKDSAFEECTNLSSIEIPQTVTRIRGYAFQSCTNLTNIKIPDKVKSIEFGTFEDCENLTSVEISENVTSIEGYAFQNCKSLTNIQIPDVVTNIGSSAFEGCISLREVKIPSKVNVINERTFQNCKSLTEIKIPNDVTSIKIFAFAYCTNLTEVVIPSKVTIIDGYAFAYCKNLTSVKIPDSVEKIGMCIFRDCISLREIEFPSNLIYMGDYIFEGAIITKEVQNSATQNQEIELPSIIKRIMNESDILYSGSGLELTNCTLNEEKNKIVVDAKIVKEEGAKLYVNSGKAKGLSLEIEVPSGTIAYSKTELTNEDVIATLFIDEGENTTNNNGTNTYTFTENGEFEYTDTNGEVKTALAIVKNIDKTAPNVQFTPNGNQTWSKSHTTTVTMQESNEEMIGGINKATLKYVWRKETEGIPTKEQITEEFANVVTSETVDEETSKILQVQGTIIKDIDTGNDWKLWIYAEDMLGNSCIAESEAFCIDNIAPIAGRLTMKYGSADGNDYINDTVATENIYIAVNNGLDEHSGHKETAYSINGGNATAEPQILTETGTYEIIVTTTDNAGNIATNTYIIKIEKESNIEVLSLKYSIGDTYIMDIQPNTTAENFKGDIETNATEINIYNKNEEILADNNIVTTGTILEIKLGSQKKTFILVVKGDLNGDGESDIKDLVQINSHRLNKKNVEGEYLIASDVNGDNITDIKDLVKINKFRLHKITEL